VVLALKIKDLRAAREWTQAELARRAGVDRRTISYLENQEREGRPSANVLLKLAQAFRIKPEELYQAAGYIKEAKLVAPRLETPEEILDRLRLASPQSIPVYPWSCFPFHAGDEPLEYVYITRRKSASKNVDAYIVHGGCLEPKVNDGDVIIVDLQGAIDNGDIVACLINNEFHVLRIRKVAGDLWLENNQNKYKFEQAQEIAPVIEIVRRLK